MIYWNLLEPGSREPTYPGGPRRPGGPLKKNISQNRLPVSLILELAGFRFLENLTLDSKCSVYSAVANV